MVRNCVSFAFIFLSTSVMLIVFIFVVFINSKFHRLDSKVSELFKCILNETCSCKSCAEEFRDLLYTFIGKKTNSHPKIQRRPL
jgi:hypothetical protein